MEIASVKNPSFFYVRLPLKDRPLSSFDAVEEAPGVFIAELRKTKADEEGEEEEEEEEEDDLAPQNLKKLFRGNARTFRIDKTLLRIGEVVSGAFDSLCREVVFFFHVILHDF